jgi:glycosyltransferase involved in cell wall biosynthesis
MKKVVFLIPAYNEEEILENNIIKLHEYLSKNLKKYDWMILVSDNCSKDKTLEIAKKLSKKYKRVKYRHLDKKPLGYSIKTNWISEDADIYSYMDADMSTDITHIPELLKGIEEGYDIVIGSRTAEKSKTSRSANRNIMSKVLIGIIRLFFSTKFSDYQCGFKAVNRNVRDNIIPKMKCVEVGFISTEMIVVASKKGYKIKEIPVRWSDHRVSKSPIFKGITDALKNIIKIKRDLVKGRYN